MDQGSALEAVEPDDRAFVASYGARGYKAHELREFRARYEGEFTEVRSRVQRVGRFGDPDTVVRGVNPFYEDSSRAYQVNCADCARSVERTWRGDREEAAGRMPRLDAGDAIIPYGEQSPVTEEWAGEEFTPTPRDGDLRRVLSEAGHGSSAIVHSTWERGGEQRAGGHAYNIVNHHGDIRVLDGQVGENLDWEPGDIHPMIGRNPRHAAMAWNAEGERIW